MTADLKLLRKTLKDNGYRVTRARELSFKLLINPTPQTISQLIDKANGLVDRVSIYRNIEIFEEIGIVKRIYIGWKYKLELSDRFISHHHHLSCLGCGQIIDIEDEKHIDLFINEVTSRFGFSPARHQFEIEGYCRNCLSKKSS